MTTDGNLNSLMAVFEKQNADGTFAFTDDEVRHYLPYLVLAARVPLAKLHPSVVELVGKLVVDAKLDMKAGPPAVQTQIEAYYEAKPFSAELHKAVMAVVRGALAGAGGSTVDSAAVERLLGSDAPKGVLGGGGTTKSPSQIGVDTLARRLDEVHQRATKNEPRIEDGIASVKLKGAKVEVVLEPGGPHAPNDVVAFAKAELKKLGVQLPITVKK